MFRLNCGEIEFSFECQLWPPGARRCVRAKRRAKVCRYNQLVAAGRHTCRTLSNRVGVSLNKRPVICQKIETFKWMILLNAAKQEGRFPARGRPDGQRRRDSVAATVCRRIQQLNCHQRVRRRRRPLRNRRGDGQLFRPTDKTPDRPATRTQLQLWPSGRRAIGQLRPPIIIG